MAGPSVHSEARGVKVGPPQFPRIQKGKVEGCDFFLCSIEKYEARGVEHIIFKVEVLIFEKQQKSLKTYYYLF